MLDQTPSRDEVLEFFHTRPWSEWRKHNANSSYAGGDPNDPIHHPVWVNNSDVRVRIEQGRTAVKDFQEDWIDGFPNPDATSYSFWLYLNDSPITQRVLVGVDGHRAYLPIPDISGDDPVITPEKAKWGRIVTSDREHFERALDYADMVIEE